MWSKHWFYVLCKTQHHHRRQCPQIPCCGTDSTETALLFQDNFFHPRCWMSPIQILTQPSLWGLMGSWHIGVGMTGIAHAETSSKWNSANKAGWRLKGMTWWGLRPSVECKAVVISGLRIAHHRTTKKDHDNALKKIRKFKVHLSRILLCLAMEISQHKIRAKLCYPIFMVDVLSSAGLNCSYSGHKSITQQTATQSALDNVY